MTHADTHTAELKPTLGWFSATAIVAGSMIGSGIFIVTADIARRVESPLWVLAIWVFTGIITLLGATSYGKLAAHLPRAGGQYVFLKEAWGEIPAFLYGWALFTVIQTGFLAAVAVAFVRYLGVLVPAISTQPLLTLWPGGAALSSEQLVAVAVIVGLTAFNCTGVKNGAMLQNVFTSLKVLALILLIAVGLTMGAHLGQGPSAWTHWTWALPESIQETTKTTAGGFLGIFAMATVGALFSSDAWNYVTFIGGEVKEPEKNLPKALALGTILVVALYFIANLAYLNLLPLAQIQHAPEDRVASLAVQTVLGTAGASVMAAIIMVSTFGCLNGMMLAGARVFYAMAKDGLLFKPFGWVHPRTLSPNVSLWVQCIWGCGLALSGTYGQLLDYIVFTAILFYILTMLGLIKMGRQNPEALRMTRWWDYALPILYILGVSYVGFYLLIGEGKWVTSVTGIGLTLLGLPVYALWKGLRKPAALQTT